MKQESDKLSSSDPADSGREPSEAVVDLLQKFESRLDRLEKYLDQNSNELEEVQRELQALSRQVEENRINQAELEDRSE